MSLVIVLLLIRLSTLDVSRRLGFEVITNLQHSLDVIVTATIPIFTRIWHELNVDWETSFSMV